MDELILLRDAEPLMGSTRAMMGVTKKSNIEEESGDVALRKDEDDVSAEIPDWSREKPRRLWDPSRRLLLAIRRYQYWRKKTGIVASFVCKSWVLRYRFRSFITASDIGLQSQIGGGLLIPHPNGILIHSDALIGPNCLIFQQVTIGTRRGESGVPVIEGHVDIGAGAKILGPVQIGAHARIDANAVVYADVPSGALAFGVPAKILRFE